MQSHSRPAVDLGDEDGGIQMRDVSRGRKVVRLSSDAVKSSQRDAERQQENKRRASVQDQREEQAAVAGADGLIQQEVHQTESDDSATTQVNPEQSGVAGKTAQAASKRPSKSQEPAPPPSRAQQIWKRITSARQVAWIAPKATSFEAWKPVIRSSASAWLGLVIILIRPAEVILGQAAFFALVVAFICPPSASVIQAVEMNFYLFFYVGLSWAWCVLAAFIADKTRTNQVNAALLEQNENRFAGLKATNPEQYNRALIFSGTYLQAKPAIVCIFFLGIIVAFFAWYKIRTAPSPFTFALVFACVLADVSLTIVPLFPTPYYTSGLLFMLPMAVQSGINVLCALTIFPQSVSYAFINSLQAVLTPLNDSADLLENLFQPGTSGALGGTGANSRAGTPRTASPDDGAADVPTFGAGEDDESMHNIEEDLIKWSEQGKLVRSKLVSSVAGLTPLKAQEHYLTKEFSYGRLGGHDLVELSGLIQVLQLRSGGVAFFFDVVAQAISHSHLNSGAFAVHTPMESAAPSRPGSVRNGKDYHESPAESTHSPLGPHITVESDDHEARPTLSRPTSDRRDSSPDSHTRRAFRFGKKAHLSHSLWPHSHHSPKYDSHHEHLHASDKNLSYHSLLEGLRKVQQPVGVYESQRYMHVEREQNTDAAHVAIQLGLLAKSALPLVTEAHLSLQAGMSWLKSVNKDRSIARSMMKQSQRAKERQEAAEALTARVEALEKTLKAFKDSGRLHMMEPYLHLFDPTHPPSEEIDYRKLPHRALFWDCLATYHLIEFTTGLLAALRKMQELDSSRRQARFWWPSVPLIPFFQKRPREPASENDDAGVHPEPDRESDGEDDQSTSALLGAAKRRNPDVQPYGTPVLDALRYVDYGLDFFTNREFLFAVKAGVLTALVALPAVIGSSAEFFYYNRGLWVIIMCQMTLALYAGETAVAWISRAQGTFWGCLLGMVLWYIGSGNGKGNAYGLAAVSAVGFPLVFGIRLYYPASPLTVIIFAVSVGLVVGYSWVNGSIGPFTNATWGFDVAWRRFVTVLIGITAAWIFALLPPSSSGKVQIRQTYSRTISQIGTLLCDIISEANDPDLPADPAAHPIRERVLAMKRKLAKTGARHASIQFEFSLQGQWPIERYAALQDVCVDLVALLSQLHHVLASMPYPWRRALLERARLRDSRFLGECLAVISMCSTSLRAGTPLPQITPGPLAERLLQKHYGVAVTLEAHESSGIPRLVTSDVLKSEEYLHYALATTTCFSIIRRFDKLLLIVKTLVGEEFHIDFNLEEKIA